MIDLWSLVGMISLMIAVFIDDDRLFRVIVIICLFSIVNLL